MDGSGQATHPGLRLGIFRPRCVTPLTFPLDYAHLLSARTYRSVYFLRRSPRIPLVALLSHDFRFGTVISSEVVI